MVAIARNPAVGALGAGADELFERARSGDNAAFAELYSRHARYIAGVVYRLLGNDGDLDDVVQETFIDAIAGLSSLQDPGALRAWLVTVAVRRTRRLLARRRRRAFFGSLLRDHSAQSSDPRDRQPVDELYDALDRLPEDLRIPWALHRIEHLSLPEAADACEVSLATVKRRIAEAEERIQKRLAP
jgi:RNA polymerase sigma-70 factor (ECF subfamily)